MYENKILNKLIVKSYFLAIVEVLFKTESNDV